MYFLKKLFEKYFENEDTIEIKSTDKKNIEREDSKCPSEVISVLKLNNDDREGPESSYTKK